MRSSSSAIESLTLRRTLSSGVRDTKIPPFGPDIGRINRALERIRSASRSVGRLTPYSPASCSSVPSRSPGRRSSSLIRC